MITSGLPWPWIANRKFNHCGQYRLRCSSCIDFRILWCIVRVVTYLAHKCTQLCRVANLGLHQTWQLQMKVAPQSQSGHLTMYYHTDILVHFSLDVLHTPWTCLYAEIRKTNKQKKQQRKQQGSSSFFRVIAVSRAARAAHALARACSCICACAYVHAYGGSCFPAPAAFCFLAKPQLPEFDWTDCTDLHKRTFCVFAMFYQPLGREAKITWFS